MQHVKRIVVGVDGSEAALSAARWALHEAHRCEATLTIVHAWQSFAELPGYSAMEPEHLAGYVDAAQKILDRVTKRLSAEPEAAEVIVDPVLIPGPPGPVLVDESTDADLLVVGSHGCSGSSAVGRAVIGSVSAYCIHHATCSTLIVPSRPLAEHRREWLALVAVDSKPAVPAQRRAAKPGAPRQRLALRSAAREGEARRRTGGDHGFAVGPHSDSVA